MDNPVHNRRSALDIQPSKRIPPSFYAALGIAIAVHAGLAYYLLDQRFGAGAAYAVDAGEYELQVGASSADLRATQRFRVVDTVAPAAR